MPRSVHKGLPHFGGVALAGFMGAGKSTVGARLAERTGWPWTDLDRRIEAATGLTIPELFSADGEAGFRSMELRILRDLLRESKEPRVLSLGGGALLNPEAGRMLSQHDLQVVVLGVSVDTSLVRTAGSDRPLGAQVRALHAARSMHYASLGPVVHTDTLSADEVVDAVLGLL